MSRNFTTETRLCRLWMTLKKINQTGIVDHKHGSGFKTHSAQNVFEVDDLILSQQNAPGIQNAFRPAVENKENTLNISCSLNLLD